MMDDKNHEVNDKFIQKLFNQMPNAVFYKDIDLIYRFCNVSFANYIGKTMDEVIGASVYDVAPKDLADIYHKATLI